MKNRDQGLVMALCRKNMAKQSEDRQKFSTARRNGDSLASAHRNRNKD